VAELESQTVTTYAKILEKTHDMSRAQVVDTLVKALEFVDEYTLIKILAHIEVTNHVVALHPQRQPVDK